MGKLARIATGVFEARHSHVLAKKCYRSKISKGELIKVTVDLAEPMREDGMIRCLSRRLQGYTNTIQDSTV
jgi:hypothetical protein